MSRSVSGRVLWLRKPSRALVKPDAGHVLQSPIMEVGRRLSFRSIFVGPWTLQKRAVGRPQRLDVHAWNGVSIQMSIIHAAAGAPGLGKRSRFILASGSWFRDILLQRRYSVRELSQSAG